MGNSLVWSLERVGGRKWALPIKIASWLAVDVAKSAPAHFLEDVDV